jgi:hypothetical protein
LRLVAEYLDQLHHDIPVGGNSFSFSSLSYDRSKASSKDSSSRSAIQSFLFLSPEEASRMCISVFGKRPSRKSYNVVVFPFAFHIAVMGGNTEGKITWAYMKDTYLIYNKDLKT